MTHYAESIQKNARSMIDTLKQQVSILKVKRNAA